MLKLYGNLVFLLKNLSYFIRRWEILIARLLVLTLFVGTIVMRQVIYCKPFRTAKGADWKRARHSLQLQRQSFATLKLLRSQLAGPLPKSDVSEAVSILISLVVLCRCIYCFFCSIANMLSKASAGKARLQATCRWCWAHASTSDYSSRLEAREHPHSFQGGQPQHQFASMKCKTHQHPWQHAQLRQCWGVYWSVLWIGMDWSPPCNSTWTLQELDDCKLYEAQTDKKTSLQKAGLIGCRDLCRVSSNSGEDHWLRFQQHL